MVFEEMVDIVKIRDDIDRHTECYKTMGLAGFDINVHNQDKIHIVRTQLNRNTSWE